MSNAINNILVALDLSHIDETLIHYAAYLANTLQAEKVYFVHNIKRYEISDIVEDKFDLNLEDLIGDELNETIEKQFDSKVEWEVLISNDPYTESLISYIVHKYQIHLTIVGNKNRVKGTGVVSGKLLRMLKCHILSVPYQAEPQIKKLCIGTDFSNASRKSFAMANDLKKDVGLQLKAMHVYTVPVQFSPYLSKDRLMPTILKHINEKSTKFYKRLGALGEGVELEVVAGESSSIGDTLQEQCARQKIDLLMLSDKGGNTFSSLLVGTLTEELFNEDLDFALWVCK